MQRCVHWEGSVGICACGKVGQCRDVFTRRGGQCRDVHPGKVGQCREVFTRRGG